MKIALIVSAFWGKDAHIWVATSDDVPGLVMEAESVETLVDKLKFMIPELLDANGYKDEGAEISFIVKTEVQAIAGRHVA